MRARIVRCVGAETSLAIELASAGDTPTRLDAPVHNGIKALRQAG